MKSGGTTDGLLSLSWFRNGWKFSDRNEMRHPNTKVRRSADRGNIRCSVGYHLKLWMLHLMDEIKLVVGLSK